MIISISGTPGTGKTTICSILKERGYHVVSLGEILMSSGRFDIDEASGELLVDVDEVREMLSSEFLDPENDIIVDGHLSYLAPWDLCIVLRLHPEGIRSRLEKRDYGKEKVQENVEAEMVSSVLMEGMDERKRREKGMLIELDCTGKGQDELTNEIERCMGSMKAKKLNELHQYLPGKVDWLEVIGEWC
jgi:adenylate kinase